MKERGMKKCARCGAEMKPGKPCGKCGANEQDIEIKYKEFKISELLDIKMTPRVPDSGKGTKSKDEKK